PQDAARVLGVGAVVGRHAINRANPPPLLDGGRIARACWVVSTGTTVHLQLLDTRPLMRYNPDRDWRS
ncbi:hypothetical protein LCGC14_2746590, partial [marine sediment metagenome]